MVSPAERLASIYREVLAIGEQLLGLLSSSPTDEGLDRAEGLLSRREALSAEAEALVIGGVRSEAALAVLRQVAEQQRHLATALQQRLGEVQRTAAGSSEARGQLQDFARVLRQGRGPSVLDQRR